MRITDNIFSVIFVRVIHGFFKILWRLIKKNDGPVSCAFNDVFSSCCTVEHARNANVPFPNVTYDYLKSDDSFVFCDSDGEGEVFRAF